MNILADESVDQQIVFDLRNNGFCVEYVAEMNPGITDKSVLKMANDKEHVLLTADKDFGELVYRQKLSYFGVILIRLAGVSSVNKPKFVTNTIKEHSEFKNSFMVISAGYVRIRHYSNDNEKGSKD